MGSGSDEERKIGFFSIILLGINTIIGSGIFLLPGAVMRLAGEWSLIVYIFVSLLVLSIAWCFAQCATLFNRNGGAYIYAKEAFGPFIGFEVGFMRWVVGIMAWASLAVGLVTGLSAVYPPILHEPLRSVLILSLLGSLGVINLIGVRIFKYLNNLVTLTKLIPLLLFVFLSVFYIQPSHYVPINWEGLHLGRFSSAALMIFYAFSGFETLVVVAGEMKNPQKNLPLAVMIVISFCSLLYFLIQLLAIGLLGDSLANSPAPLADAAELMLGETGKWIVLLTMLISIGGINLSASFITPRSGVALAEDRLLPEWIASKGSFGTPVWAIALTVGLTGLLAVVNDFAELAALSVISRFVQYISTCLSVYVLRERLPVYQKARYLVFLIPTVALIGMGWLLMQASFSQLIGGLGALAIGLPLYWLQQKKEKSLST